MSTKAERSAAAAMLGGQGKGAAKRRGDAEHYAALRLKRKGTVSIADMRSSAELLRELLRKCVSSEGDKHLGWKRVAAWLEREADRRQKVNEDRARKRSKRR